MVLSLRMPRRFLRGGLTRLALTVLALACGVALVGALDLVNRAVLTGFVEVIDGMAGRATLQVTVEDSGAFPETLAGAVAAVDGVTRVVAVVTATAFTTTAPPEALTVQAFDLTDSQVARLYQPGDAPPPLVDDPLEFIAQPDSVIVTGDFAARHGLRLGDPLPLDTAAGRRDFTVRGLVEPEGIGRAFGGALVLMDGQAAQAVFTAPGLVNRLDIVTERTADSAAVARRVQAALPAGLRVEAIEQRRADLRSVLRSMQLLLQGVSLVALAAAFLIAFSRLSMCFAERTWQLGVLRAVGVRRRAVWWELLKESQLLGLAGVALGLPAGLLLGRALLPLVATTMALNFRTVAPPGELSIRPASLLLAAALGFGAALAAAVLPAWRAASVDVAGTLRGRGADLVAPEPRRHWLALALLGAATLLALAIQQAWAAPAAGLVASATLVAVVALLARPLVAAAGALCAELPLPGCGAVGRLALGMLRRDLRRAALAVAMVGIGVGTVGWLALVAHSFERTAVRVFEQAMRADFVVSSAHVGAGALEMPVDDRWAATLRAVDGVAAVIGVRLATWHYRGEPLVLDAFDPAYFRTDTYGAWPLHGARLDDAWEAVAAGRAVVVSSNFAQHQGVAVGDTVTLDTPRGPLPLLVAGVTTDFASPRGTLEMSRDLYRAYWNDARVTRFFVQGAAGDPGLRARLLARLGEQGGAWRVISSGDLVAYWEGQIRRAFSSLYALAAAILVVVLFGIGDNLGAGVVERTRALGTLRALGVRRRQLARLVVAEALLIVALGLLLAAVQGGGMALFWVRSTVPLLLGWIVELHVPVGFVCVIALATAVSCALAALLPARRAARLEPATALRWE